MRFYCAMLTVTPLFRRLRAIHFIATIVGVYFLWKYDHGPTSFRKMNDWKVLLAPDMPGLFSTTNSTEKVILYWTKFFIWDDYGVGTGHAPFVSCSKTCFATTDRKLINKSHAIIFHARDNLDPNDLPPASWRLPHQLYVFYLLESPIQTNIDLLRKHFMGYFNLTMTYRHDSDIVDFRYGRLKCINEPVGQKVEHSYFNNRTACSISTKDGETDWRGTSKKSWHHKSKTVAWFVSHCSTNSSRELFVQDLAKYIKVDIYGKCPGSLNCQDETTCDQMLNDQYRFYLSFENSLCPDYVTEKLYRPLAHDTVPIVYGGADYTKYLPDGSYINAMNFNSPKHLADYLKNIIADDTLYSKFFEWKSHLKLDESALRRGWCSLCEFLYSKHEEKVYGNVADWWSGISTNQTCASPPEHLIAAEEKGSIFSGNP